MKDFPFSTAFFYLACLCLLLGFASGLMDSEVLGRTLSEWFYGGIGAATLSLVFGLAQSKLVDPRCPRCPPYCPPFRWVALSFYVITLIVAFFLGGWLLGIPTSGWYLTFVTFVILALSGYLKCLLSTVLESN